MPIPKTAEQHLIDTIIEHELKMFLAVQNLGGTAGCQQRPSSFKAMRWMTHSVFPAEYLQSYRNDLIRAEEQGINLMTIKYGRMDNLIPRENQSPLVDEIAAVEAGWMQELRRENAENFRSSDGEGFRRYLASELETLSEETLAIYRQVVNDALSLGRNLARERYENFKTKFGMKQNGPAE